MTAGISPSRTSDRLKLAASDAIAMLQQATNPTPPPNAAPWTRATVGLGRKLSTRINSAKALASARFSAWPYPAILCIQPRSAPAEKLFPSARSTIALTLSSLPSRRRTPVRSAMTVSLKALWTSARFRVTVATPSSRFSVRICLSFIVLPPCAIPSHPEHAELGWRDRGVEGSGDAEPQRHAGVGRIDDAVVPQPGAGVIGMALVFVLGADRRLEGLLVLRAPGFALRFHAVAAHLGQHAGRLLAPHHGDAGVR